MTDLQLHYKIIVRELPPEKRTLFLQRLAMHVHCCYQIDAECRNIAGAPLLRRDQLGDIYIAEGVRRALCSL